MPEVDLAPWLRAAFAAGYAECDDGTIFPVLRASSAAMSDALAHVDEHLEAPGGIIGWLRLEGRRTAVHQTVAIRREALERRWQLALLPILRRLGQQAAPVVARKLRPREQSPEEDAIAAAIQSLAGTDLWQEWAAALQAAWQEAMAEGQTDALAYLAALRGEPGTSFDLTFSQALAALRDLGGEWADLETWLGRMVQGLASTLGSQVADAIVAGASFDDLVALVSEVIGADDSAAMLLTGYLLAEGTSQGSLDLYGGEGVAEVNWLASAEACDDCIEGEAGNPYTLDEADGEIPQHPNCRCGWEPVLP